MDLWKSLEGMVSVSVTSADPALLLRQLAEMGVTVYDICPGEDGLTMILRIQRIHYRRVQAMAQSRGYELRLIGRGGLYWAVKAFLRRPVLAVGVLFFFLLGLWLPTRIFFFEVEGNQTIPDRLILSQCEEIGMGFGASRREVRSEKIKNALLEQNPQLQWVGVNTSGCKAIVTVRERAPLPESEGAAGVSSIVAIRDGIILSCTAQRGNLLCRVGQAVTAGEVLISGYTDCGLSIRATQAEGEIFAQTHRQLKAILPENQLQKGEVQTVAKKYALIIGKKRINFYKGSGISGTSCDKMYLERYVTLPGGFRLPVKLVTEVWTSYAPASVPAAQADAEAVLTECIRDYLSRQMVAGTVLRQETGFDLTDGVYQLSGHYFCSEMIGKTRHEENIIIDGQYN